VYFQVNAIEGMSTHNAVAEFNPAKMGLSDWNSLAMTLGIQGVDFDRVWVERVDAAFDYSIVRRALVLDDRKRKSDFFSAGASGPETQRTGFRRGSRLKQQLYDKTAERRSAGMDVRGIVSRFEVQTWPLNATPDGLNAPLPLSSLVTLPYPGDATLRLAPFHWGRVDRPEVAGFIALALGQSVRTARRFMMDVVGWHVRRVDELVDQVLPPVQPSPTAVWSDLWADEVRSVLRRMRVPSFMLKERA
jgi:hypothetical protein